MSEFIKNKYLDFSGLQKYDLLIKDLIAAGNKELADAIAALDAKLGSLEFEGSDDKSFAEVINDIYSSIADIVAAQDALGAKDSELEGKINSIIGDLESLEGSTLSEIATKLAEIDGSLSQNATDIAGVTERVATLEGTIEDLKNLGGENGLVAVVDKVNSNITAIEKLNGGVEVEGSVKKAAADAQAAAEATAAADATAKADAAESAAKEYVDSLVKDAEGNVKFDEAGAAAAAQAAAEATAAADATAKADAALKDAKDYADSLAGNYDAAGTAAALDAAMDERVKVLEAIDHEQLAADAVAAVVAGAESDFDTLKEVADWIAADTLGSAELQTTVSDHTNSINSINGDIDALEAKVDADIANLTTHMSEAATALAEVDGRLDALEAFEETHASIEITDIEGLFA